MAIRQFRTSNTAQLTSLTHSPLHLITYSDKRDLEAWSEPLLFPWSITSLTEEIAVKIRRWVFRNRILRDSWTIPTRSEECILESIRRNFPQLNQSSINQNILPHFLFSKKTWGLLQKNPEEESLFIIISSLFSTRTEPKHKHNLCTYDQRITP